MNKLIPKAIAILLVISSMAIGSSAQARSLVHKVASSATTANTVAITAEELALIPVGSATVRGYDVKTRASIICGLSTGDLYPRTSGSGFPFGTVGFKPTTSCSSPMVSIRHDIEVDKYALFGFPFPVFTTWNQSVGVSSLTTKSVEVVCADARFTKFVGVAYATLTFPNGTVARIAAKTYDTTLPCGTNP